VKIRLSCLFLALMLLAIGCRRDPNADTTPLHRVVKAGDIQQIKSLISSGADINAEDEHGYTPLHDAILRRHKDVVELLISKGADVNAKTVSGCTPLYYTARSRHHDIAELLRKHGAKE